MKRILEILRKILSIVPIALDAIKRITGIVKESKKKTKKKKSYKKKK